MSNKSHRKPPRLNRAQKLRVRNLLHMAYTPKQLSEAIGCHLDTIYRGFIPAGCPHTRDERGHIFIVGTELRDWFLANQPKKVRMQPDEGWCFHCSKPTVMKPPFSVKPTNRYLELVTGTCAECGRPVNRARGRGEGR